MEAPEAVFETISDAITYAFRREQTSLLSLDRICHTLMRPGLYLHHKDSAPIPCSSLTRRRISSTLSSSEIFVRAGPPRTCVWALRPSNPLFLSDGAISSSIENILTNHGPLTLERIAELADLKGADVSIYEHFLNEHAESYERDPDGTYWFAGQKRPTEKTYDSISQALVSAFSEFPDGATVEQLHWFLCLSNVGGTKAITRRSVSRELSRRHDLFTHCARARYSLIKTRVMNPVVPKPAFTHEAPPPVHTFHIEAPRPVETFHVEVPPFHGDAPQPVPALAPTFQFAPMPVLDMSPVEVHRTAHEDEDFNPFSFFGNDFQFAYE